MVFERLIPLIISLALLVGWEIIIFLPTYYFATTGVILTACLALLLRLNQFKFKNKDFWLLSFPAIILIFSTSLFLLFLNYSAVKQVVVIFVAMAIYYFTTYLYYFLRQITRYTPLSLESSSSYLNIVSFLFLSIASYGLINLLNLKMWYLAVLLLLASFFLTYQFFWINKITERQNFLISVLTAVLTVEFFWSVSFLPVSHFISGLTLGIMYYVLINITLLHFLEKFDKNIARRYLSVGIICIFVILLSARWL